MNGGPSGFNNAPVTKTIVIASILFTVIFGIQGRSRILARSYPVCVLVRTKRAEKTRVDCETSTSVLDIFEKLQIWKLVVSVLGFSSTPELIFGAFLLYYFRVFERQIGSNKYTVFILFSIIASLLLEVLALWLLKDPSLNILTSGPYGLIFSSFVPFYCDIPISTQIRAFNLNFSDKTFIYLAGLQLFMSSWKRSMLPGICGILAGSLYRLNVLRVRKMKFPEYITSLLSRLSWPSIGSASPTLSSRNVIGNAPSHASQPVEETIPLTSAMEPREDSIATLVSMGFDRNTARQVLESTGNDMNAATNILLELQSH